MLGLPFCLCFVFLKVFCSVSELSASPELPVPAVLLQLDNAFLHRPYLIGKRSS